MTLATHFKHILEAIGEDPMRPGLEKTPARAEAALRYLTTGYQASLDEIVNGALFPTESQEMILLKNIELYSLCEHHLLPFLGKCHVAYIPSKQILGLSKIARIVDLYARRLQVQENLTKEIAEALLRVTGALGVGVIIEAQHLCVMMRGVEKQNSLMTTSMMLGTFKTDPTVRREFLSLSK